MTKKAFYSWQDVEAMTQDILRQLHVDKQSFDCVVGLTRGGLKPAVLVSQYLDIPMHTLKLSLRDHVGQDDLDSMSKFLGINDTGKKKVLVIDDINDTGATINAIKEVWGEEYVTYAVLISNEASEAEADYVSKTINKMENDVWQVFPWEDWWQWQK
jgi:hypoxanthine phosphoribosyltransferase